MRHRRSRTALVSLATALLFAALTAVEAGQASRTRSGGGGSSGGGSRTATRSSSGGSPQVATGRATYGRSYGYYGHRYGHGYGYYGHGHYGYWGPHYGYYGYYGPWGWWPWVGVRYVGVPAYGAYVPRSAPATIETKVKPKKATVLVDGKVVGEARDYNGRWDTLGIPAGTRELEFRAQGYMSLRLHLETEPGGYYRVQETLAHGEGLDPRSTEPPPPDEPEPEPEPRRARSAPPTLEPTPAPTPRTSSLPKGFLRFDVQPQDAAVYLDGRFLARGDELARLHGAIPVAEGTHTIEVVRPGYRPETLDVDVRGREPVDVTVDLRREGT
jgi:hypothetical protein